MMPNVWQSWRRWLRMGLANSWVIATYEHLIDVFLNGPHELAWKERRGKRRSRWKLKSTSHFGNDSIEGGSGCSTELNTHSQENGTASRDIQRRLVRAPNKKTEIYIHIICKGQEKFQMIWNCSCAFLNLHHEYYPTGCSYWYWSIQHGENLVWM